MIILGIDPGSTIMGYGVIRIERNQPDLLLMGTLDQRKVCDHYEKIARIFDRTVQLIKEYKPEAMAIESPFYGNNVQSMLKLGRAQGAAISAALHHNVAVFEYAPRKIKQSITGHGEASKEQIANLLQFILKTKLQPDSLDATDAVAAALCHHYEMCNPVKASGSKNWEDFIKNNPGRISGR
ncbi:MAG TPA: crossover junction endodeoxyribonuclease RuvC [Bacteroidales bacterium]|nr:crossover junction endodeoxyribonuclease RuvC [Bacteroidales bacterium]